MNRRFGDMSRKTFELDGKVVNVTADHISSDGDQSYSVRIGEEWETTLTTSSASSASTSAAPAPALASTEYTAQFPHTRQTSTIIPLSSKIHIFTNSKHYSISLPSIKEADSTSSTSTDKLTSPMPATVIEVRVSPGDHVKEGQVCVVLESMKMEISIRAGRDGVVGEVGVGKGETVEEGGVLVVLSPAASNGEEEGGKNVI
jgi:3-methylcrotonyl-CoA carboxylase alpha subunit